MVLAKREKKSKQWVWNAVGEEMCRVETCFQGQEKEIHQQNVGRQRAVQKAVLE